MAKLNEGSALRSFAKNGFTNAQGAREHTTNPKAKSWSLISIFAAAATQMGKNPKINPRLNKESDQVWDKEDLMSLGKMAKVLRNRSKKRKIELSPIKESD